MANNRVNKLSRQLSINLILPDFTFKDFTLANAMTILLVNRKTPGKQRVNSITRQYSINVEIVTFYCDINITF